MSQIKKKKLFNIIKFVGISLVGLSVILSLFLPFILTSAQR